MLRCTCRSLLRTTAEFRRGAWVVDISSKIAGKRPRSIKTFGASAKAKAAAQALERIADHEAPAGELAGEAVAHAQSWQGDAEYLPHRADA